VATKTPSSSTSKRIFTCKLITSCILNAHAYIARVSKNPDQNKLKSAAL
jgi:hypothetical protein